MNKLLVYTNGKPDAVRALHFAAAFKNRLNAELSVITVYNGTHAAEEPPPVGVKLTADQCAKLPHRGFRTLFNATSALIDKGVLAPIDSIQIRDIPQGYMFVCNGTTDDRIVFYLCFGHIIEVINKEVDEHGYSLLITALPRRSRLGRLVIGSMVRKLALDLHTSLMIVRGGGPDSHFLVCTDGSPSARRQFPMLQHLLPAIGQPIDLLYMTAPEMTPQMIQDAEACVQRASDWLTECQKLGRVSVRESQHKCETILEMAGDNAVIMMGSSLRHDIYRRIRGSLPMKVLERTAASVLLVKRLPEGDPDFMKDPYTCG